MHEGQRVCSTATAASCAIALPPCAQSALLAPKASLAHPHPPFFAPPPLLRTPAPCHRLAPSPPPRSLAAPSLYTATLGTVYLTASAVTTTWASLSGVVIWQGFCAALSILAATAYGAGNMKLVGYWLVLCLVGITIACVPIGATWAWAGDIMSVFMGKDTITEQVRGDQSVYFSLVSQLDHRVCGRV